MSNDPPLLRFRRNSARDMLSENQSPAQVD